MSESRCPVDNCLRRCAAQHVMCKPHWFSVPRELRQEIWQLYRTKPGTPEHLEAIEEAIRMASR